MLKHLGVFALAAGLLVGGIVTSGQQAPSAPAPAAIARGAAVFSATCAACHGEGGAGGRVVSLVDSARLRSLSDGEIQNIIRSGTPNGMPAFGALPPADLTAVTGYVRSLSPAVAVTAVAGNPVAGEAFFFGKGQCATCHVSRGRGNQAGPDLTTIGARLSAEDLVAALTTPAATIAPGYSLIRVQTKDGGSYRGYARNEGNHTLPMQTLEGRLISIQKSNATITRETGTIMPALSATADEQRDLVAYLSQLRTADGPRTASGVPAASIADFDEILKPRAGDWPTYHGRLDGNRHSALAQITPANIKDLSLQWTSTFRSYDSESTPLVLDGIMYVTAPNQVSALDAKSGREIWRFQRPQTPGLRGDAARGLNRGVAVLGSRVFFVTDNAHMLALSRLTGSVLWEVVMPKDTTLPYGGTMAPLAVGNLVYGGVSGGDEGIRGFIAAYHAESGEEAWRFWTVPSRTDPEASTWEGKLDLDHAGGATWLAGTYDPVTDTLYWPTGNPFPDTNGTERRGDNLYTDSLLALDAKTGKLHWYFQFTPHDLWDWDAQEPPLLVDAMFQGQPRKLVLQANRNGFFYVLDRTNGKMLLAKPFVEKMTWASSIGDDGRPVLLPGNVPTAAGVTTCPAIRGATNWISTSFSPKTQLFYVVATENCGNYRDNQFGGPLGRLAEERAAAAAAAAGATPAGRGGQAGRAAGAGPAGRAGGGGRGGRGAATNFPGTATSQGYQVLRALNINTGAIAWEVNQVGTPNNYMGTMSTDGGVVFYGQGTGEFGAVDAQTGAYLWHFETQETWKASPMTYMVDGRQYVAFVSGANVMSFALPAGTSTTPAR